MRRIAVVVLFVLSGGIVAAPADAVSPGGRGIWAAAGCGGCHTLRAAGSTGTVGPDLDRLQPTLAVVERQVRTGGAVMPSFASSLTPAQIAAVASFVASASRANAGAPRTSTVVPSNLSPAAASVRRLQRDLAELGVYRGPVTGVYGPLTRAAVIRFQKRAHLIRDGLWGPRSQAALRQALLRRVSPAPAATLPPPEPWVARLQRDLTELGVYRGPVTGVYGPLTRAAVIRFQKRAHLIRDGLWGPRSQAALQQALLRRVSPAPAATLPPPEPWVARLQRDLTRLRFYSGPVTGIYGPLTRAAVTRFQNAARVVPDGRWGPRSQTALVQMMRRRR